MRTDRIAARRVASLAALLIAGLASLATSQIPLAEDHRDGLSTVDADGTELAVVVHVSGLSDSSSSYDYGSYGDDALDFHVRGDGSSAAASSLEVQVLGPGADPANTPWSRTPLSEPLDLESCTSSCTLGYRLRLRLGAPAAGPLIVPWRVHAIVYGSVSGVRLSIDAPQEPPSLAEVALPALAVGAGLGLLAGLAVLVVRPGRRSRRATLELVAGVVLVAAGIVVMQGITAGLVSGFAGLFALLGGIAILLPLAIRRPFLARPANWVMPIGLVAVPVALARFSVAGEYRIADATAIFGAVGLVVAICALLLAPLIRAVVSNVGLSSVRLWLTLIVAVAVIATSFAWAVLAASGATGFTVLAAVPFGAVYLALAIALWRWLNGDSITPFVVGIFTPVGAAAVFATVLMSRLGSFFEPGPSSELIIESCGILALGGVVFAILSALPPPLSDPAAPTGKAFQRGWARREPSLPPGQPEGPAVARG